MALRTKIKGESVEVYGLNKQIYIPLVSDEGLSEFSATLNYDTEQDEVLGRKGIHYSSSEYVDADITLAGFKYSDETDDGTSLLHNKIMLLIEDNPQIDIDADIANVIGVIGRQISEIELLGKVKYKGNYIGSMIALGCDQMVAGFGTNRAESPTIDITGKAKRWFDIDKPFVLEGWNSDITVTAESSPGATVQVSNGALWVRDDTTGESTRLNNYPETTTSPTFTPDATQWSRQSLIAVQSGNNITLDIYVDTSTYATEQLAIDAVPVASSLIQTQVGAGIKWCKIADIVVEPTTATITDANIVACEASATGDWRLNSYTLDKTSLHISNWSGATGRSDIDDYILFEYAVLMRYDLTRVETTTLDDAGAITISSTTLSVVNKTKKIIDLLYFTAPYAVS